MPSTSLRRRPWTITNADALRAELQRIRELGYADDDEENDANTRCISAPVFGPNGMIGCIGIDAPSVRLTADGVADAAAHVVDVARRLSTALVTARSA